MADLLSRGLALSLSVHPPRLIALSHCPAFSLSQYPSNLLFQSLFSPSIPPSVSPSLLSRLSGAPSLSLSFSPLRWTQNTSTLSHVHLKTHRCISIFDSTEVTGTICGALLLCFFFGHNPSELFAWQNWRVTRLYDTSGPLCSYPELMVNFVWAAWIWLNGPTMENGKYLHAQKIMLDLYTVVINNISRGNAGLQFSCFFQYPVTFKADCCLYTQSWREARSTAQHIYEIH